MGTQQRDDTRSLCQASRLMVNLPRRRAERAKGTCRSINSSSNAIRLTPLQRSNSDAIQIVLLVRTSHSRAIGVVTMCRMGLLLLQLRGKTRRKKMLREEAPKLMNLRKNVVHLFRSMRPSEQSHGLARIQQHSDCKKIN